jgi:copper(I)-binding protein
MRRIILLIFMCVSITGFASGSPHSSHEKLGLEVHNAWVREAPPSSKVLAAYMSLHNHTDKTHTVVSISSPQFGRAEIHRTEMKDDMARMLPVSKIMISSHGKVLFEPGGLHLMLINPKKKYKSGDKIQLTMHLSDKSTFDFTAPVKKGHGMEDHSKHDMDHGANNDDHDMNHDSHDMDHDSMDEMKDHSNSKHDH